MIVWVHPHVHAFPLSANTFSCMDSSTALDTLWQVHPRVLHMHSASTSDRLFMLFHMLLVNLAVLEQKPTHISSDHLLKMNPKHFLNFMHKIRPSMKHSHQIFYSATICYWDSTHRSLIFAGVKTRRPSPWLTLSRKPTSWSRTLKFSPPSWVVRRLLGRVQRAGHWKCCWPSPPQE